jgi:hypothetical protein
VRLLWQHGGRRLFHGLERVGAAFLRLCFGLVVNVGLLVALMVKPYPPSLTGWTLPTATAIVSLHAASLKHPLCWPAFQRVTRSIMCSLPTM